jgi:hypothetical protein
MSNISLLKAFLILRNGPDYVIGAGHRWKSGLLNMTIGLFLTFPILNLLYVQFYRGALPPTAPLIQSIGVFTSVYRQPSVFGGNYVANFRASDGKNHPVQLEALNSSEQLMKAIASGESFYLEGFVLQDGKGWFWPTFVTSVDGRVFLSREEEMENLKKRRQPFGKLLLVQYLSLVPLWIICLINALKIRRKINRVM